MSNVYINQPQVVASVYSLVMKVRANTISDEDIEIQLNALYYPFMAYFSTDLQYSKPVEMFFHATKLIVGNLEPTDVLWNCDTTHKFIGILRYFKHNDILIENALLDYQNTQNKKHLAHYISSTIDHHSKLIFVYIELTYEQESCHHVTIELFNHHVNTLKTLMDDKKMCFKHLHGHAWTIQQQGGDMGLHCNLLLMFDGSMQDSDWYLAKEVGEKWKAITAGLGEYDTYNDIERKLFNARGTIFGLGTIRNHKPKEVEKALRGAWFLLPTCLDYEGLHLKLRLPNMPTFGHGLYDVPKPLEYSNSKKISNI